MLKFGFHKYCYERLFFKTVLFQLYNVVKGEHVMFNATDHLLIQPRKVIIFSLVAHKGFVNTRTANNYAY